MAITVKEAIGSRGGTLNNPELVYIVDGTTNDQVVRQAIYTQTPNFYQNKLRQRNAIRLDPKGVNTWIVTVPYGPIGGTSQVPSTGEETFQFDLGGNTEHVTHSLGTVQSYSSLGYNTDFKGGINVGANGPEGVDKVGKGFNFSITKRIKSQYVTGAYLETLRGLKGTVNAAAIEISFNNTVMPFNEVELLLDNVSGGTRQQQDDYEITYSFKYSPNATGLTVGSITGIEKKGWHYLWVYSEDEVDTTAKTLIKRPVMVYIEKIYEEKDWTNIFPTVT